jgi:hypothetical protein
MTGMDTTTATSASTTAAAAAPNNSSSSEQPPAGAIEAIEEDDEFEEFEPCQWNKNDEDVEDSQQWQVRTYIMVLIYYVGVRWWERGQVLIVLTLLFIGSVGRS